MNNRVSDANPITRQSLAKLVGEENDLLADTPVFEKAQGVGQEINPRDMIVRASGGLSAVDSTDIEEEDSRID